MRSFTLLAASLLGLAIAMPSCTNYYRETDKKTAQATSATNADSGNDLLSAAGQSASAGNQDSAALPSGKGTPVGNGVSGGSPTGNPVITGAPNPDWDKKLIRTATLNMEVREFKQFDLHLHDIVRQAGGYIGQETENRNEGKVENVVVIKVPVGTFESVVSQLTTDSGQVMQKTISTEDVTGQLIDTRARLEAKKAVRTKYLELLKQSRNTEDILKVENEINDIQGEIEGASGRISYLQHSAAYSTINLTYYELLDKPVNSPSSPFLPRIGNSIGNGWAYLSEVLIWLAGTWPFILMAGLGWLGWKKWKKHVVPAAAQVNAPQPDGKQDTK